MRPPICCALGNTSHCSSRPWPVETNRYNLFDKEPPIIGSNQEQANTYPGTYDVLGRDFFISANLRF